MKERSYDKNYYGRGWMGAGRRLVDVFYKIDLFFFKRYFKKGDLILEIGCGEGKISRWLSERGFKIEAIDISKEAIKMAKSKVSSVSFVCGNVFSLKRKSNFYDVIFSLQVMEHINEIEDTLKEVYRILKRDGRLIIRIPNGNSWEAKLAGKDWFHWDEPYHVHHWTAEEVKKLLEKTGFTNVRISHRMWEFKQVLLYSLLVWLGVKKAERWLKVALLPLQVVFVPISLVAGFVFKNSGTVELIAEKSSASKTGEQFRLGDQK